MKWIKNNVTFERGNYDAVIARFDNSNFWLRMAAITTTQGFKYDIKRLAETYGAKVIELKYMFDDDGALAETNIVAFDRMYDGDYIFKNGLEKYSAEMIFN